MSERERENGMVSGVMADPLFVFLCLQFDVLFHGKPHAQHGMLLRSQTETL